MRVNIQLPSFHGFYESIWSSLADDSMQMDIEERGITRGDEWQCKYDEFQNQVAQEYTESYIDLVNTELEFGVKQISPAEVDSPRYYNYRTDRIYVWVEFKAIRKLRVKMKKWEPELRKLIQEHHTSYDGFISFMSNDFDEWINEWLKYDNEDFGLYLSFAIYYLLGLEHGWDLDGEFYDWICGDVSAEWYPYTEEAKKELEKIEAVEAVLGWGAYDSEKWEDVELEEVKRRVAEIEFDRKYQLTLNFE